MSELEWLAGKHLQSIADGYCPDCGHRGFVPGPRGGMMQNIECGNLQCRARFNATNAGHMPRNLGFVHRLEKQSEGGSDWGKPLRPQS